MKLANAQGFLDIDSGKYSLNKEMPDIFRSAKILDKFEITMIAEVTSTDVNTETGNVDRLTFHFYDIKSANKLRK